MNEPPTSFDSPVCLLLPSVFAAIAGIAPERASELSLGAAAFRLTDNPGLAFSAATEATQAKLPVVSVPLRGLEYLWALSYSTWVLHDHYSKRGRTQPGFDFAAYEDSKPIPRLLVWSIANQCSREYTLWPSETPVPQPITEGRSQRPILEAVANELMLCAIAWILHHELAHIEERHSATAPLLEEEREADRAATAWVLDESPSGLVTAKRGLGIAIATIGIAFYELCSRTKRGSARTHPNPAMRIFSAVTHEKIASEPVVVQVTVVMLKLLLHLKELWVGSEEYDSPEEALRQYCQVLQRAIESSYE